LAGATRKVEQPAGAAKVNAGAQIVEQRHRVREPELVVVLGRALKEVFAESGFAGHSLAGR
jgi:hypothetical protein